MTRTIMRAPVGEEGHVTQPVESARRVWHRQLPPITAECVAEHTVEADSERVAGAFVHGDEAWSRCYSGLVTATAARLNQKIDRLGGDFAHVHDESIAPRHSPATGESWLHGRFTYRLYRRSPG